MGRTVFVTMLMLSVASVSQAQVGLVSGGAQVALLVRNSPRASALGISPVRESVRPSTPREAAVIVRLSANSSYRLVVHGTPGADRAQLWVQSVDGEYRRVRVGSSVTVARGTPALAHSEPEVKFRIEQAQQGPVEDLPVRYDIVVEPTM